MVGARGVAASKCRSFYSRRIGEAHPAAGHDSLTNDGRRVTRSRKPSSTTRSSIPSHRPSRREDIIDAAVRQFARKGFVDAAIGDIADEADVVVTAVYYHFSGKDELFDAAIRKVTGMISTVVADVRADDSPGDHATLDAVIDAVWEWIDTHPDEATLVHLQLPGATRQIATLRQEFEDIHVQRAFGYIGPAEARGRSSAARRAVETLSVRALVDVLISVHTMRLADGPLSGEPGHELLAAVRDLAHRIVTIDR
jgi:AcrR family transcriptional regulator